ncbi:SEC14-like protein 5 [Seminavis robusta]|uniref:SEC14-like protein 5 n=1 Tax=Seminavis robusta TaxID=568900 RepID=A0A9N8D9E5_9STRA|nr:SEC14-like protein 5 [Seminavis robusta]|eukprot:Sro23_g015690.1 SEC14-like protein 5 (355) ;mRNA; r:48964-50111
MAIKLSRTTCAKSSLGLSLEKRWSIDRFSAMSRLWDLTEKDEANVRHIEQTIRDVDHWKNDPFEVVRYYKEYYTSKNHETSLKKVETVWRHMVQWRLDYDADTLLQRNPKPDPLWTQLPCKMLETCDRDGDPVFVDRVGIGDSFGILKHFGVDAFADHIIWIREFHCHPSFWGYNNQVRNFTVIIDLLGLSSGHLRPGLLPLLQKTARVQQDCYAGWEKRIIIIRAPAIFKIIWAIAKHFFDKHVQDALIFGTKHDYLDVLEEYVELEDLPPEIAPQGKAKGYPGYFQQVSLQGGSFQPDLIGSTTSKNSQWEPTTSITNACAANVKTKVLMKGQYSWDPVLDNRMSVNVVYQF